MTNRNVMQELFDSGKKKCLVQVLKILFPAYVSLKVLEENKSPERHFNGPYLGNEIKYWDI